MNKEVMRIFKTKSFNKWANDLLTDASLVDAVDELVAGKFDAALGKKVYKQRVAIEGAGKRGGARTIVAFHEGDNVFFMYGFEKNERANISKNEKEALQKAAIVYFGLNGNKLTEEIKAGRLVEITRNTK